jgi:DNA invertase Pin-like site-specific DNA recombinase
MATYGYVRVSTDEQATDDRSSLDGQRRRITGLAMAADLEVDAFFTDVVSGSRPLQERTEGARLMAALRPGDNLITAKLDRLFRNAADALTMAEQLKQMKVSLYILDMGTEPVTANGASRMFFGMLALVAEFERDRIRERLAEGRSGKRSKGGHIGGEAPFGYRVEGKGREAVLIPVPEQQAAIAEIRDLAAAGKSLRTISAAMAERGFEISHQGVKRLLARVFHEGDGAA